MKTQDPTAFPVIIRISSALLDDFRESELGSFEDYQQMSEDERAEERWADEHVYEILGRHLDTKRKMNRIEIRNAGEAAEVYYAACSGTFQIDRTDEGGNASGYRAAVRICNVLRPVLQEPWPYEFNELLNRWRAPTGF